MRRGGIKLPDYRDDPRFDAWLREMFSSAQYQKLTAYKMRSIARKFALAWRDGYVAGAMGGRKDQVAGLLRRMAKDFERGSAP
ncbi:MAG: hypothetical protein KGJ23_08460 [Euryarchaeota archaeon]|nr:hypothetical protein [Euryarchaeota archaeon]MDE1836634.1 hypothetical protein [Euryarchaeota archaeon]MDE1879171.1 hypothetical protein [Euryarchaeota archaeon]MDE2044604.1 hypothetical protein [Thermoplasmata archaeon]